MKVTKMKPHHFPLLYHETFRKNKLKVSSRLQSFKSGNQLSQLPWAWGNPGKERQQKEATSIYLQGLLILQAQQLLWGGSRKLSQSVIPWIVPRFAAYIGWPEPKLNSAAPSFAASSCLMSKCGTYKQILWLASFAWLSPLRNGAGRKYNLKVRTQNQVCRNRLASSNPFICVYKKINKEAY